MCVFYPPWLNLCFSIGVNKQERNTYSVKNAVTYATYSGKLCTRQMIQGDASGDTDVERFFLAGHWDFNNVVALLQQFGFDAIHLFAQQ